MNDWRLVLQIKSDTRDECLRLAGVPLVDPAHLSIWSPPGDSLGARDASTLFDALRRAITPLGSAGGTQWFQCGGSHLDGCMARLERRCRSLLIVVLSGSKPLLPREPLLDTWIGRANSMVLPVLPAGTAPSRLLPPPHDTAIALFQSGGIGGIVPNILTTSGIGDDEFRLFISYVRRDTQKLVDALHDEFVHAGWRVYVDRFRGTPGRYFPFQIAEELMSMGCVLLVESSGVPRSLWTQAEIAFARDYRLGLVAVSLPGVALEPSILGIDRMSLSSGSPGPAELQAVVEFLSKRYAPQRVRRARYLDALWTGALSSAGLSSTTDESLVHYNALSPQPRQAAVVLARRATDVADLRRVAQSRPVQRRFAMGPSDLNPPAHRADVAWLATQLRISLRSEDEASDLAKDMQAGNV